MVLTICLFFRSTRSNSNLKKFFNDKNLSVKAGESDAELDYFMANNSHSFTKAFQQSWSITSLFFTAFYALLYVVTFGRYKRQKSLSSSHNFNRFHGKISIFSKFSEKLMWFFLLFFLYFTKESRWDQFVGKFKTMVRYIYFLPAKILLLDSWFLSRASVIRENKSLGRGSRIFWFIGFPILLITGKLR